MYTEQKVSGENITMLVTHGSQRTVPGSFSAARFTRPRSLTPRPPTLSVPNIQDAAKTHVRSVLLACMKYRDIQWLIILDFGREPTERQIRSLSSHSPWCTCNLWHSESIRIYIVGVEYVSMLSKLPLDQHDNDHEHPVIDPDALVEVSLSHVPNR